MISGREMRSELEVKRQMDDGRLRTVRCKWLDGHSGTHVNHNNKCCMDWVPARTRTEIDSCR